ncbi:YczE/YyaS/YitT family protein [Fusobacterium sp.]|uniref:YczE/YyaS/YitT family protein n=1 Tax=Fusobacterium sp. TaxID=68766 RepID=UPI002904B125|nr:DUF6198 family protein [Fusobacterium sp.]MDU1911510.1 DUF6198 family protein [Fusobacterium sp.]
MNLNMIKKYALWIFSILVNAFGNFLLIKGDIGSGPWVAASIGMSKIFLLQIGICTIILNFLVFIPIIFISKKFEVFKLAGSFFVAYIFGKFLDFFLNIFSWVHPEHIISKILFFIIGNLILSCGISIYLRLNIAMNPFDQFLKTVNDYLIPDMKKANYVYLGVPFIIALLFGIYNRSLQGIGIGTLIMLFFNGSFIKLFNKKVSIPDNILTPRKYI